MSYLVLTGSLNETSRPDPMHLPLSQVAHVSVFLLIMDAKAGKKPGEAPEGKSGCLRAYHEVPIKCKIEAFVKRPNFLPDATAPK